MREVNFSIPNVNKASVNITTTLYDRRALDCTSTLPLINSLNHLAYLTTSSARIRDILTVDGGIERLVCILKEGRSKDLMEMWKWSLAFQCVVNIGVRGSEAVRTRVVEADMVPVIATILDNYVQVVDKVRARADAERSAAASRHLIPPPHLRDQAGLTSSSSIFERSAAMDQRPSRRQAPPPSIEIPQPYSHDHPHHHHHHHHHHRHHRHHHDPHNQHNDDDSNDMDTAPSPSPQPQMVLTSPPERTTFGRDVHNPRYHDLRYQQASPGIRPMQPLATAVPTMDAVDGFGLRPVQDGLRLPSMQVSTPRTAGITSQPESPTTPGGPSQPRSVSTIRLVRPALHHTQSGSGDSDDANGEDSPMVDEGQSDDVDEPIVGVQNGMEIDDVGDGESLLDDTESRGLAMSDPSRTQDTETFNITHRSAVDGSIVNTTNPQAPGTLGFSPTNAPANTNSPTLNPSPFSAFLRNHNSPQGVLTAMPRDEDVLMALQLLAYVSKYCELRTYFQESHLVPKLKIGHELSLLDDPTGSSMPTEEITEEEEEEYIRPDDYNLFPLVEKFTVRHHSKDMQYWAEEFVNVHFGSATNGRNTNGNSQSVVAAVEPSTAVKNARKLLGCTIDTGATARHDNFQSTPAAAFILHLKDTLFLHY
ncbi:putative MYND domain protein [Talaromyces proteolyticus]|uniref:MYND domain protein n=1 Tax=Talaromyces proteolyticus TaxID=1131652 RepID=A0AAD4KMK4_9EURO|nr:putative MYND domain protein [Talaromyces proteolyticus]KAH8696207.1 putative MYND domain protein [Talaromyces proteolyticus]